MDLKSQVAKGLDLRKTGGGGVFTISHPLQHHLPAGTPKDPPVRPPRLWLQTACARGTGLSEAAQTQGLTI